jgi:hypothetical protein
MSGLRATQAVSPVAAPPEQRDCEVPTTCQPPSSWVKDPWPAVICGIGPAGLSLSLGRRFERGSGLAIELPGPDGTATVLARVMQVQARGAGSWLLTCDFISELSGEEIEHVLRLDSRYQPEPPVLQVAGSVDQGARPEAENVSVQGVLFQAKVRPGEYLRWYVKRLDLAGGWPLPRGHCIELRVSVADGEALKLKVKSCELFGPHWFVQCKLLDSPSAEVLRALTCPFVS